MIKQKINTFIFHSRGKFFRILKILTTIVSPGATGLLLYYYGYPLSPATNDLVHTLLKLMLYYYSLNFILRSILHLQRQKFLRDNWLEGVWASLFMFNELILLISGHSLPGLLPWGVLTEQIHLLPSYRTGMHLFLLVFIVIVFLKLTRHITSLPVKPSILFIGSFLILILAGTGLLLLPEMTVHSGRMSFINALFTATSATCVTGLIVVDTATFFSLNGQLVILILMQAGGIGIITFTLFLGMFLQKGFGLKQQMTVRAFMDAANLQTAQNLLKQVVILTFTIELAGIVLIYFLWAPEVNFQNTGDKIFHTIFHGISAFCNAGFSTFTNGLYNNSLIHNYLLHLIVAILIFIGGLGFPVIRDLTSIKKLRDRMRHPWKDWELNTKVIIYASLALVLTGTVLFYFLEAGNTLDGKNESTKLITSLFQSITTRTAGFNTVDTGSLRVPTLILFIFFMFVGASPASTGGGIKTTTFVIVFMALLSTIQGKKQIELNRFRISNELLNRAYSIFFFAVSYLVLCIFLLSITDPGKDILSLVFEEISAFCTVGLSMGITPDLSAAGKFIITLSMFVGRVGILTLAVALSAVVESTSYSYPRGRLLVG